MDCGGLTHQPAKEEKCDGELELWWNRGVTSVPSADAFPAEASPLETMVQRYLPRSFCRDMAEWLTLHPLISVPA